YRDRGGAFDGLVVPYSSRQLRTHRLTNWTAAGITRWVQQGARHTYCSNWLAAFKDVNELVLQSGHHDVDTMWRNYHQGVPESESLKFWAIIPAGSEKIVPFKNDESFVSV